jgi:NhaA family Na+:H+ antiporter
LLPAVAAIGGMLVPALVYLLFTHNSETRAGFGIPMATDIAFSLSALLLLGRRLPPALRVFLTAFAIVDDLGAILVIALFYSSSFSFLYLALGLGIFLVLVALNRLGVQNLAFYLIPGFFMWYFIHLSGIHAVIAGVLLAFAIPFRRGVETSPSTRLEHFLEKPVALIILPLFALANTGVVLARDSFNNLIAPHTLGIYMGLLVGKPLGIVLFSYLAVKTRLCELPENVTLRHITGAGFLGGIGFTMSIFVTFLAFGGMPLEESSKIAILLASLSAAAVGLFLLSRGPKQTYQEQT